VGGVFGSRASSRRFRMREPFASTIGQRLGYKGKAKGPSPEGTESSVNEKHSNCVITSRLVIDTLAICRNIKWTHVIVCFFCLFFLAERVDDMTKCRDTPLLIPSVVTFVLEYTPAAGKRYFACC